MKLLMIGLDGVDEKTFRRGWTPFVESMLDDGEMLKLEEDLLSRGWSEIVTGKHASLSGALYERPKMNGTLEWTESFRFQDIEGLGDSTKAIWQVANEHGYRTGIMNVPTTFPASEVDGFFVSGGGGGGPVTQKPEEDQVYPKEILRGLVEDGYVVDERLGSLLTEKKLFHAKEFFECLDNMNEKRCNSFVRLSQESEIDFGFVVFKSSPVTIETLMVAEIEKKEYGIGAIDPEMLDNTERFYRKLDGYIEKLVTTFADAQVLLVSDHSIVPRKAAVNLNQLLINKGLQIASSSRQSFFSLVKNYKHLIPESLRTALKKNSAIKTGYESLVTFNKEKSLAFSMAFSNGAHGIYVNDRERFGGPVDKGDVKAVAEEIVNAINVDPECLRHNIVASLKSANVNYSRAWEQFPDIVVSTPDGFQTSNRFSKFITETPLDKDPMTLHKALQDKRLSGKGHTPLAVVYRGEWLLNNTSSRDLTAIYDHIVNNFAVREK